MAEYGAGRSRQVLDDEPDRAAADAHAAPSDGAPKPWYRSRVLLALWALMVALVTTLIIYGIVELSRGGETSGPTPSTSSTSPTQSSTPSPTNTPSTGTETPPPPETPEQTPQEAPPPANGSPAPAEPPQRRRHLHIPSTITLPRTVITLPHGF